MPNQLYQYSREPQITPAAVKTALQALRYHPNTNRSYPLENLLLVELLLRSPDMPAHSHNRRLALQHILIERIMTVYGNCRSQLEMPIPNPEASKNTILSDVKADLMTGHIELIGWSWLYHLYGRYELELEAREFWKQGAFEERTRRRYQNHALRRLAEQLHDREWEARKHYRKRHLHLKLPTMSQPVIGRDDILADLEHSLDVIFPVIWQITGEDGIGKTALIRELLRRQIKTETLDDLFWFSRPESVKSVEQALLAEFNVPSLQAINSIAADYRIVLVLDGVESLEYDLVGLNYVLAALPHLMIYLTNRRRFSLPELIHHVTLKGLKPADAQKLMDYLKMTQRGYDFNSEEVEMILGGSEGNPGRMKAELQSLIEIEKEPI
jgi:hypothetical protein